MIQGCVVYVGPPPGPMPGQHFMRSGPILPLVHPDQTSDEPPMSFVSVFPSRPPIPGSQPPPPLPDATYAGGKIHPDTTPLPGQPTPHGPPGFHPSPYQDQPVMPHGPQPPPNPDQPPAPRGAHPPHEQSGQSPHHHCNNNQNNNKKDRRDLGVLAPAIHPGQPQPPQGNPGPPTRHIAPKDK
ncbi:predicted protein [Chaetomium globosum CBS 148.51]|uniref:Uncharacterized protein n=1 Tax=Chaetomium globosum (strain ATCC 6205 / CBS 148.51 / DSM 1962 / NBRC 6347 / NRRL 1970) TaxID=306901 RepID=Q2H5W3_CHAGB|nr:uncharacterized protein CHGG_05952 [Chaetomium globosum CBS 148.51]EAQ89333.1 predicted protein [Chaetomium globosum CBS 148.51]